jgi:hypothetical protein
VTVLETTRASLRLLNRRDRRLLALAVTVQMSTAILDFVGVTLVGLAGTLSFAMVAQESPPPFITQLATAIGLGELSDARLLAALAAAAAMLLIAKSIVAPLLMARVFRFLARREAIVSARLTKELLARPLSFVQLRSTQETARALLRGTRAAISTVLGQAVTALSDLALLTVLAISLLVVNPAVALGAIVFLV